jgi:Skp family chaperone for outer membrane proteins
MRILKTVLVAAAAAAAAAAIAVPAFSQGPAGGASVAVINSERLILTSEAGKDLAKKVNDIARTMQGEVQPDAQRLQGQQKSFEDSLRAAQQKGMTIQQVRADPAIRAQAEAIEAADRQLSEKVNVLAQDLAFTRDKAYSDLLSTVDPILDEVMKQRNITLVLQASAVAKGRTEVDLTNDVLALLNQRAKTVTVARLKAPPPPQPLAAPKK